MRTNIRYLFFILLILASSCSEVLEFSPHDADVENRDLNIFYTKNLNLLGYQNTDTLSFVVFSDPHFYYDRLASAIKSINSLNNIAFVVACGDITETGMAKEYEYYWKRVKKLKFPVVSVVGNHDYLSNGGKIFKKMFGHPNFSFLCGNYKFIAFDDVIWEKGNVRPDFEWLKNEVEMSDQKCIILTHIPPWGDQFTDEHREEYYKIAANEEVLLNVHGHEHKHRDTIVHNKRYLVNEALFDNEYYVVHLTGNEVIIDKIRF